MTETVREFIQESYQLISASTPTVPLQGNDLSQGIKILNRLVSSYSSSGLLTPIAKEITYNLSIGQSEITFASASYLPAADVQEGRLSNAADVWLLLDGVTYPLVIQSRDVFLSSYKYDPQVGLPRFAIIFNETNITRMRVYPGASQEYELHVYGKFESDGLTANDDMSSFPDYELRFLHLALARDLAGYKGRMAAWTEYYQNLFVEAKQNIESVSTVNLTINSVNESMLNGAWRVRAGV